MTINIGTHGFVVLGPGSEWFWAALQFVVISITLVCIYRQLRIQGLSHAVSVLSTLDDQWNSQMTVVARLRTCERLKAVYLAHPQNSQAIKEACGKLDGSALTIADFLEDVAVYSGKRFIPRDLIWHAYSWYVAYYWAIFQDGIKEMQNDQKDATLYSELPKLVRAMDKESARQKAPTFSKTPEDILKFLDVEIVALTELAEKKR